MRAIIHITIEDDTPEEQLIAAGASSEWLRDLYEKAFQNIITTTLSPGGRSDLHVEIEDNTKEADK